ncbi:MAG: hypothetical protein IMW89_20835 [Ktedonobacteraceae bacterium]|nr:hypothetical protein [Ktedonobacteraceae bacterium]
MMFSRRVMSCAAQPATSRIHKSVIMSHSLPVKRFSYCETCPEQRMTRL